MAQEEKTKKKNRLSYMILSVIIAIIAWILVVYITDPEITKKFTGIPVEIIGDNVLAENGFVIVNRNEIPNTSLKMSGRRSDLMKSLDKARVVIDVSQIKDEGEIELETSAKGAQAGVSVEKIGAETISVSISSTPPLARSSFCSFCSSDHSLSVASVGPARKLSSPS